VSCTIGAGPQRNLSTQHIGLRVQYILEYVPKARALEEIINVLKVYIVGALYNLEYH
jgi:hypothetical protein